jgi:hypothetical protein
MVSWMSTKKGVAPLVATLLLITFAIGLGTVIMSWGSTVNMLSKSQEERLREAEIRCDRLVSVNFFNDSSSAMCYSSRRKNVRFDILNNGTFRVVGINLLMFGDKNSESTTFDIDDVNLDPSGVRSIVQPYEYGRLGPIIQLEVIPKIVVRDEDTLFKCTGKRIIALSIPECI